MFRRLIRWATTQQPSVQYELQRMTYKGGWKNFHTPSNSEAPKTFDEPPEEPTFSSSSGYPPGRYRCIERVDGRIQTVIWTTESPDSQEYYEQAREKARQREQLEGLDAEELQAELTSGESFDALPTNEVVRTLLETIQAEQDESNSLSPLEQRLLEEVLDDDESGGPSAALAEYQELNAAKRGQCYHCYSTRNVTTCSQCGDLVCRDHRDTQTNICSSCLSDSA